MLSYSKITYIKLVYHSKLSISALEITNQMTCVTYTSYS